MRLERWGVRLNRNGNPQLYGIVTGHPLHADGSFIVTSKVEARKGELLITHSGSEYELGEIDQVFARFVPVNWVAIMEILPRID